MKKNMHTQLIILSFCYVGMWVFIERENEFLERERLRGGGEWELWRSLANAPGASYSREIARFYIHWQAFVEENLHTLALPFREIFGSYW